MVNLVTPTELVIEDIDDISIDITNIIRQCPEILSSMESDPRLHKEYIVLTMYLGINGNPRTSIPKIAKYFQVDGTYATELVHKVLHRVSYAVSNKVPPAHIRQDKWQNWQFVYRLCLVHRSFVEYLLHDPRTNIPIMFLIDHYGIEELGGNGLTQGQMVDKYGTSQSVVSQRVQSGIRYLSFYYEKRQQGLGERSIREHFEKKFQLGKDILYRNIQIKKILVDNPNALDLLYYTNRRFFDTLCIFFNINDERVSFRNSQLKKTHMFDRCDDSLSNQLDSACDKLMKINNWIYRSESIKDLKRLPEYDFIVWFYYINVPQVRKLIEEASTSTYPEDRYLRAIKDYYGLSMDEGKVFYPKKLEIIAQEMGISRQAVTQLIKRGMVRLGILSDES